MRQQAHDFLYKETAGKFKTHGYNFFVYIFRYKKAISKMSEILEGPVERIIVETKEAPAPVGPYSQVGGNLKRKYPEIEGEKEARRPLLSCYIKFNFDAL